MKKIFLLFLLSLFISSSIAQLQTASLDSLFDSLEKRELAFGSALIIHENAVQDESILYRRSVGYSRIEGDSKIPSDRVTRYKIGSVSKMFTAVMIFQLIEEKKLKLDQKLSKYFPAIPNADKITIAHLLNHRSGLHDYTKDTDFENWMSSPKSREQLLQLIIDKGSDFEPGTKVEYCNSNYLLLSYILESATGLSYDKNLEARITSKIKVWNKAFIKSENQSLSYKYNNGVWKPVTETHCEIHSGAGNIVSTPLGIGSFIQMLFDGQLIQPSSLTKMTTLTEGYGMGIFPYDHGSVKGYGHNGRIEEFYTAVRYYPEKKLTIVYITNGINFPRADILESMIKASFGERIEIPFSKAVSISDSYAGTYTAEHMPEVTVSVQNQKVIAETQGARFELEPVIKNYFMHSLTGYYFEFVPAENALRIKETDNVYFLKKK